MVVVACGRAHAVTEVIQTITFCKLAEQHRHKMRPCVIALAVLVGLMLFNLVVERISTNFLENLRKKCDLQPEVGYMFLRCNSNIPDSSGTNFFFYCYFKNVLDRCGISIFLNKPRCRLAADN